MTKLTPTVDLRVVPHLSSFSLAGYESPLVENREPPAQSLIPGRLCRNIRALTAQWLDSSLANEWTPVVRVIRILLPDRLLSFLKRLVPAQSSRE